MLIPSQAIYDIYGDYLFDKREYHDAALAYVLGGKPERAMSAYEKAHAWRELFALASKQKVQGSELEDICDRVSGRFRLHVARAGTNFAQSIYRNITDTWKLRRSCWTIKRMSSRQCMCFVVDRSLARLSVW